MFGYALEESLLRHPMVLPAMELQRRLGISYNAARKLKQRVQLFCLHHTPAVEKLIREELRTNFARFKLPPEDRDRSAKKPQIGRLIKNKKIPQVDTLALFSASQRANKGRSRYKYSGQTASIYMSDRLGGKQIGSLVHIMSWKKGPLLLHSIPDQTMRTLGPILDKQIPKDVPFFSDEGYRFYSRVNKNHRMINHSARSKENRYKWARDRWSRDGGITNQVAEGNARAIKQAMRGYSYFRPEYSPLYLGEFAFLKSVRYYGLERIAAESTWTANSIEERRIWNAQRTNQHPMGSESIFAAQKSPGEERSLKRKEQARVDREGRKGIDGAHGSLAGRAGVREGEEEKGAERIARLGRLERPERPGRAGPRVCAFESENIPGHMAHSPNREVRIPGAEFARAQEIR